MGTVVNTDETSDSPCSCDLIAGKPRRGSPWSRRRAGLTTPFSGWGRRCRPDVGIARPPLYADPNSAGYPVGVPPTFSLGQNPPMRMSQMLGTTLRDVPAEIESTGHRLLLRAGFVRQLGQGSFSYLPLGWRTLRRIEDVMREEMTRIGGAEVSMPVVVPAELWRQSGRFDTVGEELTRLKDRRERDMVLALTHEEVATSLGASEITSYRQLPKLIFQIQTKWRDDPRPRAGLIRTREFLMKDSYSFDADDAGLDTQYRAHFDAYHAIFRRCRLPVMAVGGDVGIMGGSEAHEFMYLTPIGEDTLILCTSCDYAANRQVATAVKPTPVAEAPRPVRRVPTPGSTSIEQVARHLDVPIERTLKTLFVMVEHHGPVIVALRGDTFVNENKLSAVVHGGDVRPMTDDEIASVGAVAGYGSPVGTAGVTIVADDLAAGSANLVAGANEEGWHLVDTNAGRDWEPTMVADVTAAEDGAACVVCGSPLRSVRGVEVGNIFKLGTRYAELLGAVFTDHEGRSQPLVMGCYGIGLGRLLACVAEEHHDDKGLMWPAGLAPFAVHLTAVSPKGSNASSVADEVYDALEGRGVDVLYDDRGERPGVQFADADLIGLPVRLTVSERSLKAGGVELKRRDREESTIVDLEAVRQGGVAELDGLLRRSSF